MNHWLIRSRVCSHPSLTLLLRTAGFAEAPLRSLAHSLARSLTRSRARGTIEYFCPIFNVSWITVEWLWNWRIEYWAIHSSARSFTSTAHSLAFSAQLTSLARSAALIHLFAHSPIRSLPSSWERGFYLWLECVDFMQFQTTVGHVFVCASVSVCQYACVHECMHACVSAPLCIHRTGRK